MVFRGLGCGLSPFWGFCVPIGLVWSYDIRSVRGYSIHSLSHTPVGLIHLFIQLSALGWFPPPLRFLRAYLVWLGCLVPGLYKIIQYILTLSPCCVFRFAVCYYCQ